MLVFTPFLFLGDEMGKNSPAGSLLAGQQWCLRGSGCSAWYFTAASGGVCWGVQCSHHLMTCAAQGEFVGKGSSSILAFVGCVWCQVHMCIALGKIMHVSIKKGICSTGSISSSVGSCLLVINPLFCFSIPAWRRLDLSLRAMCPLSHLV